MRKALAVVGTALLLAGCSDVARVSNAATVRHVTTAPQPDFGRDRHLGLLGDRANDVLFVGDSEDQAAKFYHPPPSAYAVRELPQGFEPPYHAESWTSGGPLGSESKDFGVIYYDTKVAMAMFHEMGITATDVNDTEADYEREYGAPQQKVSGNKMHYWFWDDPNTNERLMICAVQDRKDPQRFDLTTAVGNELVMDALRMSPSAANDDRQAVEKTPSTSHTPQVHLH